MESHGADQDSGLEEITEEELLALAVQDRLLDFNTCLPARVDSFDASAQTVDVTIMIKRALPDGQGGWTPGEEYPKLADVPVGFMRGGGCFASFPLTKGDFGMVICAQRNIGNFRATGEISDPGDVGMFTLDGAWFIPAVAPDKARLSNVSANDMVLGRDGDPNTRIVIKPTEIQLGAGATKEVARNGDQVQVTIPANTVIVAATGGVLNAAPIVVNGTIQQGSAHIKAVD